MISSERERIAPVHRPQHGTALTQNIAVEFLDRQFFRLNRAVHQTVSAVPNAKDLPAISLYRPQRDGADRRIQPGAIAAAGQNPDFLCFRHR